MAYKTTAQTGISSGTKISFQAEAWDTNSDFDSATNYRYTAPVTGFYLVKASCYVANATSFTTIDIYKNGSRYVDGDVQSSSSSGDIVTSVYGTIQMAAGDYIECFVRWGGGGTRSIYGVTAVFGSPFGPTRFEATLVSMT